MYSGMFDHAAEGLCSPVSDPQSDAMYVQSLRRLSQALPQVKRVPDDLEARLDCQIGIWLSIAGRQGGVQMGVSHAIGHMLRYNHSASAERRQLVAAAMGRPAKPAAAIWSRRWWRISASRGACPR